MLWLRNKKNNFQLHTNLQARLDGQKIRIVYKVCFGADPGFLERTFICIKGWWFALLKLYLLI